jgi:spore coat polysaccharide biosynthesis protein SpsF
MCKKVGIIIQARMGSSRLPGKILLDASGKPMLQYLIDKLNKIECVKIIATTDKVQDDEIVQYANNNNVLYFRGSESNVLSRYYECAKFFGIDIIVRITSDCPLIDENLLNESIRFYLNNNNENCYLSNSIKRTFPRGFDFEIFSFKLLSNAFINAKDEWDKEHVTPFIYQDKSGHTIIEQITNKTDESHLRITLDTKEDYKLIKILIEKYQAHNMKGYELISLLNEHPELIAINKNVEQKKQ